MKITLINTGWRFSCDGSHLISALLKRAGHPVRNVLLARPPNIPYRQDEIDQLHEIVKGTDLVMIAVYSSFADRAIQVSGFVRKKYPGMKVIWGGPHCISAPEFSLRYADGVCFAEGDKAIVDLADKMEAGADYLNTPNMAFNVGGSFKTNNVLPPFSDMDNLPYYAIRYFDFFQFVAFGDDDFLLRDRKQLEDFAGQYRKKVGLPFGICVSANTFRREKMEILLDAGLKLVQLGVQSGSQRVIDEIFDRKIKVTKTWEIVRQVEPFYKTHGLNLLLDFIIDNPYETRNDIIQTYRYLTSLPNHVRVNIFSLAFFPGTPIYNKALKDGIIEPYSEDFFRFFNTNKITYQRNYETILILLFKLLCRHERLRRYTPRFVLRALGSRMVRGIASIFPFSFYASLIKTSDISLSTA